MSNETNKPASQPNLRSRAVSQITGHNDPRDPRVNASAALAVLHDLASSPATAAESLKLLHELQVYQVELDLQEEELRRAMADLETALYRQVQLYEFSPAGCFTVDRSTAICELNPMGARLLGLDREALLGRRFDGYLDPASSRALHSVLTLVADGATADGCALRFSARDGLSQCVYASVGADPAGGGFLMACVAIRESAAGPAT